MLQLTPPLTDLHAGHDSLPRQPLISIAIAVIIAGRASSLLPLHTQHRRALSVLAHLSSGQLHATLPAPQNHVPRFLRWGGAATCWDVKCLCKAARACSNSCLLNSHPTAPAQSPRIVH